jgi:ribosomal-protein-alanine N-acetyltransferase
VIKLPIRTRRISITHMSAADLKDYERLISQPEIAAGAGFDLVSNQKMLTEVAKRQISHPMTLGLRIHDHLAGAILLYEQIDQNGFPDEANLEMSYFLDPVYWNQGFMTEAVDQLTQVLKHDPTVKTVNAEVFTDNLASKALLNRLGFEMTTTVTDPIIGRQKAIFKLNLA